MIPNLRKVSGFLPSVINSLFWRDDFPTFFDNKMRTPPINVVEEEKEFRLEVAAPELEKGDFRIKVVNNILEISFEKETQREERNEDNESLCCEFNYTSFSRSFSLPKGVDTGKIEAKRKDGMIEITLPKKGK